METNDLKRIGQGNTAELYQISDEKVLKLFRSGMNENAVEQEYRNHLAVSGKLDFVPKIYEKITENGRNGIVYEYIHGSSYLNLMMKFAKNVNSCVKRFAKCHTEIHSCSCDELETVKHKLERDIRHADLLEDAQKEEIITYMNGLPDGDAICHFDFHPGNMMISGGKIYVLDWMTACKGEPLADVARTMLLLNYGVDSHMPILEQKILKIMQQHIAKVYFKEYQRMTGCRKEDMERWIVPVAAARLCEWIGENEKRTLLKIIFQNQKK